MHRRLVFSVISLLLVGRALSTRDSLQAGTPHAYFAIKVVDQQTGRGVPLVELETVNAIRYVTDSNGLVAFHEPGLMNQTLFFHVKSHGYEFPKDGFGYRGTRVHVTAGGATTLKIRRINIAERLYRVTGGGIYRDSTLVGQPVPLQRPCINGLVLGQDSVLTARYRDRMYWFWGDTNRPSYPLGNFHAPGAVSRLPNDGGLDPDVGVDLDYFVDDRGFAKPTAHIPGKGPTWLDGLTVLRDPSGKEHMLAHYVKIAKPMKVVGQGVVEFNDQKEEFDKRLDIPLDTPLVPHGHSVPCRVGGVDYIYFPMMTRVRADVEDYLDPTRYETYSCFQEGSRRGSIEITRDQNGTIQYAWKCNTVPLTPDRQRKLIADGRIRPHEGWFQLTDIETGKRVRIHARSISWSPYRRRWIMIVCESFGTSLLGEIWYAEADTPIGPWVYARKIVTHDRYSFYNPKQHPLFAKASGRVIYFEGTYTHTFSGNPERTPRYDYNQIMYRLDLADSRLVLPVPVYQTTATRGPAFQFGASHEPRVSSAGREIAFYACDRTFPGAVEIQRVVLDSGVAVLRAQSVTAEPNDDANVPVFFALPARTDPPPPCTVPLYEFVHNDAGPRRYSTRPSAVPAGYRRQTKPLCLVWRDPRSEIRN